MARQWRIEFPGALYHILSRGNARQDIFLSDEENSIWEDVKHGFIYGSQDFVSGLKARFMENKKDLELPQLNSMFNEFESALLLDGLQAF